MAIYMVNEHIGIEHRDPSRTDPPYVVMAGFNKGIIESFFQIKISDKQWEEFLEAEHRALHDHLEIITRYFIKTMFEQYFGGE